MFGWTRLRILVLTCHSFFILSLVKLVVSFLTNSVSDQRRACFCDLLRLVSTAHFHCLLPPLIASNKHSNHAPVVNNTSLAGHTARIPAERHIGVCLRLATRELTDVYRFLAIARSSTNASKNTLNVQELQGSSAVSETKGHA